MKFILAVILIALLSGIAELFLPWWSVAIASFLISFVVRIGAGRSFLAGFLGVGVCWLFMACLHDVQNDHILSTRMAALFHLPGYGLFIAVTIIIGGLVGGFAAWAGANPIKKRPFYTR